MTWPCLDSLSATTFSQPGMSCAMGQEANDLVAREGLAILVKAVLSFAGSLC